MSLSSSPFFLVFQGLSIAATIIVSFILRRTLVGHSLRIGKLGFRPLSLLKVRVTGVLYDDHYHYTFEASSISIHFHLPTPTLPRWLSFKVESVLYTSETAHISADSISVLIWAFPQLFKQTAGPWSNVEFDGLRIRIPQSRRTPYFIKRLRENIVGATLRGDIYRLDDLGTTIQFCGLTEKYTQDDTPCRATPDDSSSDADTCTFVDESIGTSDGTFNLKPSIHTNTPLTSMDSSQDEIRISAFARGLHLCNNEGRIYTFGAIDAQLRRNWCAQRGTFVMIAKECRWVRVHWGYQREKVIPWWLELFSAIVQFPYNLTHAICYPLTTVNLYVSRLDIHFDEFRIRDAELVSQTIVMIREQLFLKGIEWQDVFLDALARAILGTGT